MTLAMAQAPTVASAPMAKSKSPVDWTMVSPIPMMPIMEAALKISRILVTFRKLGDAIANMMETRIVAIRRKYFPITSSITAFSKEFADVFFLCSIIISSRCSECCL